MVGEMVNKQNKPDGLTSVHGELAHSWGHHLLTMPFEVILVILCHIS